jgi:hypothetical protein
VLPLTLALFKKKNVANEQKGDILFVRVLHFAVLHFATRMGLSDVLPFTKAP